MFGINKNKKAEELPLKEELKEAQPQSAPIEISDEDDEIELPTEEKVEELIPEKIEAIQEEEVEEEPSPHPMLISYNYILELESRLLNAEETIRSIVEYLTPKKEEEDKKK